MSPRTDRNSTNSALSPLLLSMSSSVAYREVKAVRQVEPRHCGADTCSTVSYLSLRLTQDAKLKIKRHSVFVEGGYEFWSLRDE